MNLRTRRRSAALTSAAALAAGLIAALPGPAAAVPGNWPATDGKLLYTDVGGQMAFVRPDGSSWSQFHPTGDQGAWSADGSQVAFVNHYDDHLRTAWADSETTGADIAMPSGSGWHPADPTFWNGGGDIVFTAGGRLRLTAADGTRAPKALFGTDVDGCDSEPSGAVNGMLAFVRTGTSCGTAGAPAVWVYNGRSGAFTKLAENAKDPSISPDGRSVAFTRSVGGHRQLFKVNTDGTGLTQLTTDAVDHNRPAWSPQGNRIAYDVFVSGDPEIPSGPQVRIHDLGTGTQTQVPQGTGTDVAWQPLRDNAISRVYGSDTYDTNIASSKWTWNTVGAGATGLPNANAAVLISKSDAAYATTATSLAGKKRGPVLMTSGTGLDSSVQTELKRMLPKGRTVYLVGGTKILSSAVASKVTSLGYVAKRLSDVSRYSTSVAVAKAITSTPKYVFLATGADYHNALAASSAAGSMGSAGTATVLLTDGSTMTASVYGYLNKYSPGTTKIITVGIDAESALTKAYKAGKMPNWPGSYSYYRVAGSTPQSNAVQLANLWWSLPSNAAVASVGSWRGGVSASSAMTTYGPLLWTDVTSLPYDTKRYLMRMSSSMYHVAVFGGSGSVDASLIPKVGAAIGVGTRYVYTPYYKGVAPQTTTAQPLSGGSGSAPSPDLAPLRVTATK
ncbi:cell wall-binding repeat-containing protein [Streptomyces sp. DH10]|uniref:cell wall-binding repeat-containing protein n=1 Tax=Streptomyces sp. DH10 TaxID=3040121 RepID=UPI002441E393|nr:cell wall-binding repeat-containing protein [Streptomyces sp. DH10]MDG9710530.1 cell wall-binding repeat-containing protein [Streptomyces sp. DH10]